MNWEQLRKRVIERMSEYSRGAADTPAQSSMSATTIYERMTEKYRDILALMQERASDKLEAEVAMTYTAGLAPVTLPAGAIRRPILGVVWDISPTEKQPLTLMTRAQYDDYLRMYGSTPVLTTKYGELMYFLNGQTKLNIIPPPATALSLTLRVVPGVADLVAPAFDSTGAPVAPLGDSAGEPDLLAVEHHAAIAVSTAASFLREVGNNRLNEEEALKIASLLRWAERSPQDGPRYVE